MKQNENYEKKYKEALERASHIKDYNTIGTPQEIAELIFPELRENEDEKIRKFLIELLSNGTWRKEYPFSPIDCVAWLEKQKEQMCNDCPNRGNSPKIPLSEFEKNLERKIKCYTGIVQTKTAAKQWAKELMSLAKKQMCKDCPNRGNTHSYLQGYEDGKKSNEQKNKEI